MIAVVLAVAGGAVLLGRWPRPAVQRWAAAAGCAAVGGLLAAGVVGVPVVTVLAVLAAGAVPRMRRRSRGKRRRREAREAWPDAVQAVRAGVRAGAPVPQAVADARVPDPLVPRFREVRGALAAGRAFSAATAALRSDPVGERVAAVLVLADDLGAADTGEVLDAFGRFLRAEIAQDRDIAARHSWNVTAARVAVAAPWLTVAALSLQPGVRADYAEPAGAVLLAAVGAATAVAYLAMLRIAGNR